MCYQVKVNKISSVLSLLIFLYCYSIHNVAFTTFLLLERHASNLLRLIPGSMLSKHSSGTGVRGGEVPDPNVVSGSNQGQLYARQGFNLLISNPNVTNLAIPIPLSPGLLRHYCDDQIWHTPSNGTLITGLASCQAVIHWQKHIFLFSLEDIPKFRQGL